MEYLYAFLTGTYKLLTRVPDTIWGVILGAGLTFVGSWISGKITKSLQLQQLDFERTERVRERTQQLRRDVYLPAADATVNMVAVLGRMLNLSVTDAEAIEANQAFAIAISRVQLVASSDTIRAVSELQRLILKELAQIQADIHPMRLRKSDLDIAKHWQDSFAKERAGVLEQMTAHNLEGGGKTNRFDALKRQFEYVDKQCADHSREWGELSLLQFADQVKVLAHFVARLDPLLEAQTRALVKVRKELELEAAESVLLEELKATAVVGKQALESMLATAQATMEAMRANLAEAQPGSDDA
jgi:hypothetical protein